MEKDEYRALLDSLPKGSVVRKKIKGRYYYYNRFTDNGKTKEKYIPFEALSDFITGIEKRKALEREMRDFSYHYHVSSSYVPYNRVLVAQDLEEFILPVKEFRKRDCFNVLLSYLDNPSSDKVFILYGLRRTGKTTLIRQAISEMSEEKRSKCAFMQISHLAGGMREIDSDLKHLKDEGYKYIFIDEVTLVADFVDGAALFSDIYASSGIHIVLSGTDSLGFAFAENDSLFDRAVFLHTTYISFGEFCRVLGIKDIDQYIRYGGTMKKSGESYIDRQVFSTAVSSRDYLDSAVARNIQHSLKNWRYGTRFQSLQGLYGNDEMTGVVNRIMDDMNHSFTLEVFLKTFKPSSLALARNNIRRDRELENRTVLDSVDEKEVTERLKERLEIKEKGEYRTELGEGLALEVREYLKTLDLIEDVDVIRMPGVKEARKRTLITQPGLRFSTVTSLIESLMEDEVFSSLSYKERMMVEERIAQSVMGQMLEDIVLLDAKRRYPDKKICVVEFPIGEYDMVIYDKKDQSCELYEIKHSKEVVPSQARHLLDEEKNEMVSWRFGRIVRRCVLYRGQDTSVDGVEYRNVEDYLLLEKR